MIIIIYKKVRIINILVYILEKQNKFDEILIIYDLLIKLQFHQTLIIIYKMVKILNILANILKKQNKFDEVLMKIKR